MIESEICAADRLVSAGEWHENTGARGLCLRLRISPGFERCNPKLSDDSLDVLS